MSAPAGAEGATPMPGRIARRVRAHPRRLIVPLLALALTGAAWWRLAEIDARDAAVRDLLAGQRTLAEQVARAALGAARDGAGEAAALTAVAPRIAVAARAAAGVHAPAAVHGALEGLAAQWHHLGDAVARVLARRRARADLRAEIGRFQSIAAGVLVASDELLDALAKADAPMDTVRAAGRQLMLVERISANVSRLLEGGEAMLGAADRAGRDAVRFGNTVNALLDGPRGRGGIEPVRDEDARKILQNVAHEYRAGALVLEQVVHGAASLDRLDAAVATVGTDTDAIVARIGRIEAAARRARAAEPLGEAHLRLLGALALLSLLAAAAWLARDARAVGSESAALEARADALETRLADSIASQEASLRATCLAVERLGAEIERIAEGDPPARVVAGDDPLAPLERTVRLTVGALARYVRAVRESARALAFEARGLRDSTLAARSTAERQREEMEQAVAGARAVDDAARAVGESVAGLREALASGGRRALALGEEAAAALATLDSVAGAARESARCVQRIADHAGAVRELRASMQDLAERNRMLALNVSIQGSMESEAGRALARFADEVERVAERARTAVRRADAVHDALAVDLDAAEQAAKRGAWLAESGATRGRAVEQAARALGEDTGALEASARAVDGALATQAARVDDALRGVAAARDIGTRAHAGVKMTADAADALARLAGDLEAAAARLRWARASDAAVIDLHDTQPALPFDEDGEDAGARRAGGLSGTGRSG